MWQPTLGRSITEGLTYRPALPEAQWEGQLDYKVILLTNPRVSPNGEGIVGVLS